jgi:5'-nucleotidase
MNISNIKTIKAGPRLRRLASASLVAALAAMTSGCFLQTLDRDVKRGSLATPWWCNGVASTSECYSRSLLLDIANLYAEPYPTLAAVPGAVAVSGAPANTGHAVALPGAPAAFNSAYPNVLLYTGSNPDSRLAGVAWRILSVTAPEGFPGSADTWTEGNTGEWWLSAWIVRGYENHPDVFAAGHPCLATGVTLSSTTDACFTASHTEPFEVVVSNDDGVGAHGIDQLVEGLYGLPNVTVQVVAPALNQSGSGGQISVPGSVLSGVVTTTASGKPATAVYTTDPAPIRNGSGSPADSVLYALGTLYLSPELVISGINEGQNMGSVVGISGTVGAARRARLNYVPAIASSQGTGPNFATSGIADGVAATLALLEEWRLGRTVNTSNSVLNINIPTCVSGLLPRGTVQTVVSTGSANYGVQDCASTAAIGTVVHDIDAFNKGFIGIADVGKIQPPNWP